MRKNFELACSSTCSACAGDGSESSSVVGSGGKNPGFEVRRYGWSYFLRDARQAHWAGGAENPNS